MGLLDKLRNDTPIEIPRMQVFLLGMLGGAGSFFGTAENGQLNTWINSVIRFELEGTWEWWYVPLMTTFSALMGLIFLLIWGAISDQTDTKYGKRRPFLLGGIVAGVAMVLYVTTGNFWICFFLDVVLIGIFMNMLLAGNKALVPDMTKPRERGRVNSYINIISGVFGFGAIVFFLLIDSAFTNTTTVNLETVEYLNKTGHYIILITTGIIYILIAITCFLGIRENPTGRDDKLTTVNAGSEKMTSSRPGKWYKEIAHSFKFSELKKEWEFFKMLIATLVFNIGSKMFLPWIFEFVTALPLDFLVIGVVLLEYIFLGFGMSVLLGKLCDKYGRKKPLIYSILIGCGGFFMVPVVVTTMNIALLIISIGLMLFILNGVVTILGAWTQDLLPDEKRGQFIGINNMSNTVNQMIGVWIGGAIYGAIDQPAIAISWQVFFASFLFIASIPIFMRVKETLVLDGTPMKITTVGSSQGREEKQS